MIKYINLTEVIKSYLQTNLKNVSVDIGKFGELPSVAPCIWIYIEPARNQLTDINSVPVLRKAKITFFAIADASVDKSSASLNSVVLIEQVESLVFSKEFAAFINQHELNINNNFTKITYTDSEQPLNFDAVYSDFAVSYLEIWINYANS